MAVANDYVTGTITLTNGSSIFTGTGTAWRLAGFRDGDRIYVDNLVAIIAPNSVSDPLIDSNTSGKLTVPWTGTTGSRAYRMSYKPDGARVTAETRNLIELLGNGTLEQIAELIPSTNAIIRGDASGTAWEKFNATAAAFSTFGTVVAANKAIYYTDANTAATYDLTAAGRALLDDPNAAAQLVTLGAQAALGYTPVNKAGDTWTGTMVMRGTATDAYQLDNSTPITLANGAAILLSNFSGLILINSFNGPVSLWIVGGGIVTKVSETTTFGLTVLFDNVNVRYGVFNGSGSSQSVTITTIRTRPGA